MFDLKDRVSEEEYQAMKQYEEEHDVRLTKQDVLPLEDTHPERPKE